MMWQLSGVLIEFVWTNWTVVALEIASREFVWLSEVE